MAQPKPVWLVRLGRVNMQQRALVHRVAQGDFTTLCGKTAPHGPQRFQGQPAEVQCPSCQSAQKRLS